MDALLLLVKNIKALEDEEVVQIKEILTKNFIRTTGCLLSETVDSLKEIGINIRIAKVLLEQASEQSPKKSAPKTNDKEQRFIKKLENLVEEEVYCKIQFEVVNSYEVYDPISDSNIKLGSPYKISNVKTKLGNYKKNQRKKFDDAYELVVKYLKEEYKDNTPPIITRDLMEKAQAHAESKKRKNEDDSQLAEREKRQKELQKARNIKASAKNAYERILHYKAQENAFKDKLTASQLRFLSSIDSIKELLCKDILTTEEIIKLDWIQNMFVVKKRFSPETINLFKRTLNNNTNGIDFLRLNGAPIPSKQILKKNTSTTTDLSFDTLISLAHRFFEASNRKRISSSDQIVLNLSIDATALNQDISIDLKDNKIYGFEEVIKLENDESFRNLLKEHNENNYNIAANVVVFMLNVIDGMEYGSSNVRGFIIGVIPKTKYTKDELELYITTIREKTISLGMNILSICGDNAPEHRSYFNCLLSSFISESIVYASAPFLKIDLGNIKFTGISDSRHLQRKLISQFLNGKRVFAIGSVPCIVQDVWDLYFEKEMYSDLNFPSGFLDSDIQNHARANFLISDGVLNYLEQKKDSAVYHVLNHIGLLTRSIQQKKLTHHERLRFSWSSLFFLLLQNHRIRTLVENDENGEKKLVYQISDHSWSTETMNAVFQQVIGLTLMIDLCRNSKTRLFPFKLQEYYLENLFSEARGFYGNKRNLNYREFIRVVSQLIDEQLSETCFKKTKPSKYNSVFDDSPLTSTDLAVFDIFPSESHIHFIIVEEYEKTKALYQQLDSDFTDISLIKLLSTCCNSFCGHSLWNEDYRHPEFSDVEKQQFYKLESDTKQIFNDQEITQEKKTRRQSSQTNAYFELSSDPEKEMKMHKVAAINNFFNIEKSKQDANRQRRFISTRYKISETSRQSSQCVLDLIESEINDEFIELGECIIKRDRKQIYYHIIHQIVSQVGKKTLFHRRISLDKAPDAFYLCRTYVKAKGGKLVDVSTQFHWLYESFESFEKVDVFQNEDEEWFISNP